MGGIFSKNEWVWDRDGKKGVVMGGILQYEVVVVGRVGRCPKTEGATRLKRVGGRVSPTWV